MTNPATLKKYVKGQSGNPAGRPKGTLSLTTIMKNKLSEVIRENGKNSTEAQSFIDSIIKRAKAGNDQMAKLVMNYVDGMPKQEIAGVLTLKTEKMEEIQKATESILKNEEE